MKIRQDLREGSLRIALVCLGSYAGTVCGILMSNNSHFEWSMLNPANVALMLGGVITPVANIILLVHIMLATVYVLGPLPRWACVVFPMTSGAVVAAVRLAWRSG